jgi:hypothetical protein
MARAAAPGIYGDYTDQQMQQVRRLEQRKAAYVGEYACQIQLAFTSAEVKNPRRPPLSPDTGRSSCRQPRVRLPAQSRRQASIRTSASTMRTIAALRKCAIA